MIPEGTQAENVTREAADAVISNVLAYLHVNKATVNRTSIAKAIGIAATTLGTVLNHKYPGNWGQIAIDLDHWLEEQQKRDSAPRATSFVWTKVAEEIRTIAELVSTARDPDSGRHMIGLVYGPKTSGTGKTMTLERIARDKPGSILVRIEKVNSTPTGLMQSIARAMKIGEGHTRALHNKIKQHLAGTPRLLMIDQIHSLCGAIDDKPLHILAELNEHTGAPQLWCGTTDIVTYLERGQSRGKDPLSQIRSRIGIQRDLLERVANGGGGEPLYSLEEIRQVFAKGQMRLAPDAARYLMLVANSEDSGALRTCRHIVTIAIYAHQASGITVLTAEHLRGAHKMLAGQRVFTRLEAQTLVEGTPLAKVG